MSENKTQESLALVPTITKDIVPKCQILTANITLASEETVTNEIVRLAKLRKGGYVCAANVHMVIEAYQNPLFARILNDSVIATPDGMPVALAMALLYGISQKRIAGPDLMLKLFNIACQEKLSVFFYGSTEEVLDTLLDKLSMDFPGLEIAGRCAPPFRPLMEEEERQIVQKINESGAQLIFVCLGCPKQEIWMAKHQAHFQGLMIGVGAAFSFYTGQLQRAPEWMQKYALEWLFRLYLEPKRLLKRYLITNTLFLILISIQMLKRCLFR